MNARQEKRGKACAFHRVAGCFGSTARAGLYGPVPGKMRGSGEPGVTWRRCKKEKLNGEVAGQRRRTLIDRRPGALGSLERSRHLCM